MVGTYGVDAVSVWSGYSIHVDTVELHDYHYYYPCRFNMAKSCIFHELIELSRDEETNVRIASLETLVDLLDFFERR